ncbi:hypothetical protein FQZ97_900110 [compost metagenome]
MDRPADGYDFVIMALSGDDRLTKALLLTSLKLLGFMTGEYRLQLRTHARPIELLQHVEPAGGPMAFFELAAATARAGIISARLDAHLHKYAGR